MTFAMQVYEVNEYSNLPPAHTAGLGEEMYHQRSRTAHLKEKEGEAYAVSVEEVDGWL